MRYRITGIDEKTREPHEIELEAGSRDDAIARAAKLGLIAEDVTTNALDYEAEAIAVPVRYAGLRFCGKAIILIAWIQAIASPFVMAELGALAGLSMLVGAFFIGGFGTLCLAVRDLVIHTVPAEQP